MFTDADCEPTEGWLAALLALRAVWAPAGPPLAGAIAAHAALSLPFVLKAARRDPSVAAVAPLMLLARSAFQAAGIASGGLRELREARPGWIRRCAQCTRRAIMLRWQMAAGPPSDRTP